MPQDDTHQGDSLRVRLLLTLAERVPELVVLVLLCASFLWYQDRMAQQAAAAQSSAAAQVSTALDKLTRTVEAIGPCRCEGT